MVKPSLKPQNDILRVFLMGLALSFAFFLPFIIAGKGIFIYYGDFDVQQIPFYQLCHDAVRNGEWMWNWNTDLGANFIGSYSFYTLGSPFFWLTIPFPSAAVPYLMAPLLMLKFALTGVTGYAYIRRFVKSSETAILCGLLYSFSGFNLYNIFFNHFNEVVLAFPLLLIGMEEFVVNKRRGVFALAVAFCALVNYYFFVGEVIFCVIYFFVRLQSPDFKLSFKEFCFMVLESVLGLFLSMGLLLPSLIAVASNPRAGSTLSGFDLFIYGDAQRYGLILSSFFFPPDIPARPNFFPDSNAKWSSVSMFLPFFSMTGVFAFFKGKRKHFVKTMLLLSFAICFIPFLNSAFSMFNYSYYARWFYMPLLLMALATGIALEEHLSEFRFGIGITAAIVALFSLIGIVPKKEGDALKWFSLPPYPERFWAYVTIAVFGLLILSQLIQTKKDPEKVVRMSKPFLGILTFTTAVFMLFCGSINGMGYDVMVERGIYGKEKISLEETGFYRIDTYGLVDNLGMFLNKPSINAFHSVVPASIMEYYPFVGVDRNVATRADYDYIGVRAMTSTKYVFTNTDITEPPMPGYSFYDTQNGYNIFQNDYFIPMGFAYDYLVTDEQVENAWKYKDRLFVRGVYLDTSNQDTAVIEPESQFVRYQSLLPILPDEQANFENLSNRNEFLESCLQRAKQTVSSFDYDSRGFTAQYRTDRDQILFFSVPYDAGWRAWVDGEEVEILKANVGFMAVPVTPGDHTVEFRYRTPGLTLGLILSGITAVVFAGYLWLMYRYADRLKKRKVLRMAGPAEPVWEEPSHTEIDINLSDDE